MTKDKFYELINNKILILDGAMGTELQKRGYLDGVGAPEEININNPEHIKEVHRDYLEAGANIILANTFGGNRHKLDDYKLGDKLIELNQSAIKNAREVANKYNAFVAGDIGSIGSYLKPLGPTTFDQAYDLLEFGWKHNPENWEIAYYLGFIELLYKGNTQKSLEWLSHALLIPGHPPFIQDVYNSLLQKGNFKNVVIDYLKGIYESSEDVKLQEQILEMLNKMAEKSNPK